MESLNRRAAAVGARWVGTPAPFLTSDRSEGEVRGEKSGLEIWEGVLVPLADSLAHVRQLANSIGPADRARQLGARYLAWPGPPMDALRQDIAQTLTKLADVVAAAPTLALNTVRYGLLPTGPSIITTAFREGISELHWKTFGDALARVAQHSGPVPTKLGQILATRDDILPEAVCERLQALYTRQPPMGERQLKGLLAAAFPRGMPFKTFGAQPIAVGSIGEVHRGELPGGEPVVIKLLRPGVRRAIDRDLNAIEFIVDLLLALPRYDGKGTRRAASRALHDLGAAMRKEVDLRQEADTLEEFGRRFRTNPRVRIPKVYREWSSDHALVMEHLCGEPLSAFRARAKTEPEAAKKVASLALKEILTQVFAEGYFHADPHAGNLLILPDGRLGLIDLGLVGESVPQDRKRIANAVRAFVSRDPDLLSPALLAFGEPPAEFDHDTFRDDIVAVLRQNEAGVVAQLTGDGNGSGGANRLEQFVNELFRVAYAHEIYVPPSTTLLIKAVVTIEGVARALDPNINIVAAAIPIVLRSLSPRWLRWRF